MATIPVEKKSPVPVWALLLGLLLLALVIWFVATRDDDETAATDPSEEVAPLPAATGLDLSNAWVTRVIDDNTFFVAPDSAGTDETLVTLTQVVSDEALRPGDRVTLSGERTPLDPAEATAWGVTDEMMAAMGPDPQVIRASSYALLNRPMPARTDDAVADSAMAAVPPTAIPGPTPSTGTITSTDDLYGTDLKPVIGRRVELTEATVLTVNGDSTFYVGSGGKRFLVALSNLGESQAGPGDGSDGRFNIDVGQTISLRGTVVAFDAASPVFRGLSAADRADATTRGAFVNVTRAADVAKK